MLRWGEAHFDRDGSKRFLYARVLFSCQLFREGVAHLAKVRKDGYMSLFLYLYLGIECNHENQSTTRSRSTSRPCT